ncbi:MAG: hypothetical protein ACOZAA_14085 [Pseudomonadota bacterium]
MTSARALLALLLLGAAAVGTIEATGAQKAQAASSAASPQSSVAAFEALERSAPTALLASEADYHAFADAMRAAAPMSFGSFAQEGGGVVAHDVTISLGDNLEGRLAISELRLYGVDAAGLAAAGKNSAGAAPLAIARRIDARGFETFGLEALMAEANSAYMQAIIGAVEKSAPDAEGDEVAAELQKAGEIQKYELSAGRIVIDGFTLHRPDAEPAKAQPSEGLLDAFRVMLLPMRMMSFEAGVIRDLKGTFASGPREATSTMTYAFGLVGQRGWRRGDLDDSVLKDMRWSMTAPIPATAEAQASAMDMSGGVELYSLSNLRLAKLLDYWARGVVPPSRETSLLSLGVWRSFGERYEIAGAPFYSVGETFADFSQFRWFAPTSIRTTAKDLSFDIGGFMDYALTQAPTHDPEAKEMTAALAAFERHGLSKIDMSYTANYDWAPKSGKTVVVADADIKGLGRIEYRIDAGLPDFKTVAGLAPKSGEPFDAAAMSRAFAGSTLNGFTARIADRGLLTRAFALAADLQAQSAGGAPQGAIKAEDLRAGAALALRAAGGSSPAGAALFAAIGDFIAEGGVLTVDAKPKPPVPFVELGKAGPNGETPIDRLKLSATSSAAK